jgi:hypothetical protein
VVDQDQYEVYLRVSSDSDEDRCLYTIEHWFADKPGIDTIRALFDEAKRDYDVLFPDDPAEDFSVQVKRLEPRQVLPPTAS